jgi:hypothetical protein
VRERREREEEGANLALAAERGESIVELVQQLVAEIIHDGVNFLEHLMAM